MANTVTSQYLGMPVPVPTVDPGPDYAVNLNSCLTLIDQHDHSSGKGQQVTPAGISINTDLPFSGNNATLLRSTRFSVQSSTLSGVSDLACVYVSGVDLYYNDVNGNRIRITQSGNIVASPGNITNLVAPAAVVYNSSSQTFVFQSSTGSVAGNLDGGSVTLRSLVAGSSGATLQVPNNVSNYTWTLPQTSYSGSSAFIYQNSSGILSYYQVPTLIAARYTMTTGQTLVSTSAMVLNFNNIDFDTSKLGTTGPLGSWVLQATAPHSISANIMTGNAAFTVGDNLDLEVWQNSSLKAVLSRVQVEATQTQFLQVGGNTIINGSSGDVIQLKATVSRSGGVTLQSDGNYNYASIHKIGF